MHGINNPHLTDFSFDDMTLFGEESEFFGRETLTSDWNLPYEPDSSFIEPQFTLFSSPPLDDSTNVQQSHTLGPTASSPYEGTPSSIYSETAYEHDYCSDLPIAGFTPLPINARHQSAATHLTPATSSASSPVSQSASSPSAYSPAYSPGSSSGSSSTGSTAQSPRLAVPIERSRTKRRKTVSNSPEERQYCQVSRCNASFSRKSDLHRHNLDVHQRSGKQYKCSVQTCYYSSRRTDKVKEHCQKMHGQPRGSEQFHMVLDQS